MKYTDIKIGSIWKSNGSGEFKIISEGKPVRNGRDYSFEIEFLNTGYKREASTGSIITGQVNDLYAPTIEGHGFVGEGKYTLKKYRTFYDRWRCILARCFNPNCKSFNVYNKHLIDNRWLNFQNFAEWYEDNFIQSYEIDKDIICNIKHLKTKVYSPETCLFIPGDINGFLAGDSLFCGISFKITTQKIGFYLDFGRDIYDIPKQRWYEDFYEAKKIYSDCKYKRWKFLVLNSELSDEKKNLLLQYDFTHFWRIEEININEIFYNNKNQVLNIINL